MHDPYCAQSGLQSMITSLCDGDNSIITTLEASRGLTQQ